MKKTLFVHLATLLITPVLLAKTPDGPVTLRVTPDREYILRGERGDLVFKIDLQGVMRRVERTQPLNLAVVLDRSGSMRGAKLEKAKQAAAVIVDRLTREDRFSLVTYDSEVEVVIPAGKVTDAKALHRVIDGIKSGGSTALHAGVKSGAEQVREFLEREKVNRVILLSDGLANVGPKSPSELAKLGSELQDDGIGVTTVGLGDDYNEDLMVALAEASAANYYYVQDAEKLPEIFAEELGHLQSIIARGLRIIIEVPKGVEALEVMGHPEIKFRDGKAEIALGELYGGQERFYLVRCQLKDPAKEKQTLGVVQLAYLDAAENATRRTEAKAAVNLTEDAERVEASTNKDVLIARVQTEGVQARSDALESADGGKVDDAVRRLRGQAAAATVAAPSDPRAKAEAERLNEHADSLEQAGEFDKSSRKAFQYENYRLKNQKSSD